MFEDLSIGIVMLAIAGGLIFVGLPDKAGVSPRFLRFSAALTFYPALNLIFIAGGVAELFRAFYSVSN
jgi:hypothetical protein